MEKNADLMQPGMKALKMHKIVAEKMHIHSFFIKQWSGNLEMQIWKTKTFRNQKQQIISYDNYVLKI